MHKTEAAGHIGNMFVEEDVGLARPPTQVTEDMLNAFMMELANIATMNGAALLTPGTDTYHQCRDEIMAYVAAAIAANANYIVRYTTTGNVALTGLGTQAGGDWPAALTDGDLILVKDNTTASQNGWYNAYSGAWTRATFADASAEIRPGALTNVTSGTTLADSIWMLTTDGTITLGTTSLNFSRKDAVASRVGEIFDYAGTTPPAGALALPTAATNISRATYAALFAKIGTTWGAGDGSTTFGMPYCPTDHVFVQANGNVGTSTAGQVITHTHGIPLNGGSGSSFPYGLTSGGASIQQTIGQTPGGGSANLAAGIRALKCVWYN